MQREMTQMMRMMPTFCWALLVRRRPASWADTAEMMLRVMLACLEMGMMLAAVPLWFILPGGLFAAWGCVCAGMVMAMCWMMNGKEQMYQCNAGSESWMMGQEAEDEKWVFLGGMGMRYEIVSVYLCRAVRLTDRWMDSLAVGTATSRPSRHCHVSSAGRWCAFARQRTACPLTWSS